MNREEIREIEKLGFTPEQFARETYYLDHNIAAREALKEQGFSSDINYNKEQQAIKEILKKPLIKNKLNPISLYKTESSSDRKNPYFDIK